MPELARFNAIRVHRESLHSGSLSYMVYGLNVLGVNRATSDPAAAEVPYTRFLVRLVSGSAAWALVGGWAIQNWINEVEQGQGRTPEIKECLGREPLARTAMNLYGGRFFVAPPSEQLSAVASIRSEQEFFEVVSRFLGWDAVAFLLGKEASTIESIHARLEAQAREWVAHEALIAALLAELRALVLSEEEGQYLRVLTSEPTLESVILDAATAADSFVTDTEWFRKHAHLLVWSDLEQAYVIR